MGQKSIPITPVARDLFYFILLWEHKLRWIFWGNAKPKVIGVLIQFRRLLLVKVLLIADFPHLAFLLWSEVEARSAVASWVGAAAWFLTTISSSSHELATRICPSGLTDQTRAPTLQRFELVTSSFYPSSWSNYSLCVHQHCRVLFKNQSMWAKPINQG
jgi:hypothetical protein